MAAKQAVSAKFFIILSILTGLVGAFVHPLMSYFLVDGLNVQPVYIGLYMVSVTLSGLVISQMLGGMADKGVSSRKMYMLANTGIVLALLVYIFSDQFMWVLFAGVCLMAIGNASMPQVLTLSRQWAGDQERSQPINITAFNARIRAGISFSWMIGPPLAFVVLDVIGFSGTFSIAIVAALVGIVFVWQCLPEQKRCQQAHAENEIGKAPWSFWCLATAIVLGSMGNNMYTSALPLYTLKELQLPSYTPGLLMGLVAGLEIPVMLFSSRLCRFVSKQKLMIVAFVFGFLFYFGMFAAETLWQFVALQCLNAVFYGLFAGIGLTLMQEQLPKRIGFTAAVYSNGFKVGVMLGASCTGFIAQLFSFQYALIGAMIASLCAIGFMLLFHFTNQPITTR